MNLDGYKRKAKSMNATIRIRKKRKKDTSYLEIALKDCNKKIKELKKIKEQKNKK